VLTLPVIPALVLESAGISLIFLIGNGELVVGSVRFIS
jgi:hypothetical protein